MFQEGVLGLWYFNLDGLTARKVSQFPCVTLGHDSLPEWAVSFPCTPPGKVASSIALFLGVPHWESAVQKATEASPKCCQVPLFPPQFHIHRLSWWVPPGTWSCITAWPDFSLPLPQRCAELGSSRILITEAVMPTHSEHRRREGWVNKRPRFCDTGNKNREQF